MVLFLYLLKNNLLCMIFKYFNYMKLILKLFLGISFSLSLLTYSCVPARQFEDLKSAKERCETDRDNLKRENESFKTNNNEFQSELKKLKVDNNALVIDTTIKGNAYRTLIIQYDKINDLYAQLLANQEKLRSGADADAQKAMSLLQITREELQRKEDELRALETRLNQERANLNAAKIQNELKEKEIADKDSKLADKDAKLADKEAKVRELQAKLNAQDSIMRQLKSRISEALIGFEGNGLTITHKDGKVYVSLDEKLLFKSGKWDVDPKGTQALQKLAVVLENNPDIDIMIEGHTDDLAYGGNGPIQDNWDLSVKRATAIIKIILANSKIAPTRLTAAGKGQFLPVDVAKTTEARAKNRRTEIILTPKLDALYELMNNK